LQVGQILSFKMKLQISSDQSICDVSARWDFQSNQCLLKAPFRSRVSRPNIGSAQNFLFYFWNKLNPQNFYSAILYKTSSMSCKACFISMIRIWLGHIGTYVCYGDRHCASKLTGWVNFSFCFARREIASWIYWNQCNKKFKKLHLA
jgi:hypothetical protein